MITNGNINSAGPPGMTAYTGAEDPAPFRKYTNASQESWEVLEARSEQDSDSHAEKRAVLLGKLPQSTASVTTHYISGEGRKLHRCPTCMAHTIGYDPNAAQALLNSIDLTAILKFKYKQHLSRAGCA